MWLDSTGKLDPLPAKPRNHLATCLSPDGKRLALIRPGDQGLWVYDWQRDIMNRLNVTPDWDASPVWSPDSKHITLRSGRAIHWIRADGSGKAKRLTDAKNSQNPFSFSPDGKRLVFIEISEETRWDIWTVPLAGGDSDDPKPGKPELFLRTRFNEWAPAFSPDGRWLAYASNESGRYEIYIQPFPEGGVRWQVSSGGGAWTVWSRTRPELFYLRLDDRIMAVTYSVKGDAFIPETPRVWSEKRLAPVFGRRSFDLAPDGNRVVALMPSPGAEEDKPQTRLTFLLNFFDELRRRLK